MEILVNSVQDVSQMVLVVERVRPKLAVQPACSCLHERVVTSQLRESVLLQERLDAQFELMTVPYLFLHDPYCMKNGFLYSEVWLRLLQISCQHLQVTLEVVRYFLFPGSLDWANGFDQLNDLQFGVEWVRVVNLHPHVLNGVLIPYLVLLLSNQEQGQCDLVQESLDVSLNKLPCFGSFQGNLYEFEGRGQRPCPNKVGPSWH